MRKIASKTVELRDPFSWRYSPTYNTCQGLRVKYEYPFILQDLYENKMVVACPYGKEKRHTGAQDSALKQNRGLPLLGEEQKTLLGQDPLPIQSRLQLLWGQSRKPASILDPEFSRRQRLSVTGGRAVMLKNHHPHEFIHDNET